MQIDFHHAVTYILARLGGFAHGDAAVIAHAAQYVDDAKNGGEIRFTDGSTYDHIASAHTVVPTSPQEVGEFRDNLDNALNAQAWLPFHFLPGNLGLEAGQGQDRAMIRRLACTPDSPAASRMLQACIAGRDAPNALHRLGITAHVYADTWAHQGFVGLDTPFNSIKGLTHSRWTFQALCDAVKSKSTQLFTIGHAMVLTFPDEPYLTWGYTDRDGVEVTRDNPAMYLQASQRLVAFFREHQGQDGALPLSSADLQALKQGLASIGSPDPDARHAQWVRNLGTDAFSFGPLAPEELRDLDYVPKGPGSWKEAALGTTQEKDDPDQLFERTPAFDSSHWKHFHDALKDHRAEVLNRILPEFGLDPALGIWP